MQTITVAVQNAIEPRDMGVATSGVTFFRSMGGAFGTAILGAVLSSRLAVHLADALAGAPAGAASRAGGSADLANNVEAIKALPEPVHSLVTGAFSNALHDTFLSAVPLVVVALVVALFLKEKPLATRDSAAAPSAPESEPETVRAPRRTDRQAQSEGESPDRLLLWRPGPCGWSRRGA